MCYPRSPHNGTVHTSVQGTIQSPKPLLINKRHLNLDCFETFMWSSSLLSYSQTVLVWIPCLFISIPGIRQETTTQACDHMDLCVVICALISSKWLRRALWEALGCFYWSVGGNSMFLICASRAAFKRIMSGGLSFDWLFTSVSQTNKFSRLLDEVPSHSHLVFALRKML